MGPASEDGPRGVQAVELGHLHVHEDQVVAGSASQLDGLIAVFGQVHLQPDVLQQELRDLPVDGLVFGDQDLGIGKPLPQ